MDNMENKRQRMVTSLAKGGLPPAPQHTQKQAGGMLGIQLGKIKGWWRKGDIRTTKPRKFLKCWLKTTSDVPTGAQESLTECWLKTTSDVPTGAQESLTEALMAPQHNVGKDAYTVDLESNEKLYWLGTESGLLGAFGFEGACTAGDGSCDPSTRSMGAGFCNFSAMQWNTAAPLPHVLLQEQRLRESST